MKASRPAPKLAVVGECPRVISPQVAARRYFAALSPNYKHACPPLEPDTQPIDAGRTAAAAAAPMTFLQRACLLALPCVVSALAYEDETSTRPNEFKKWRQENPPKVRRGTDSEICSSSSSSSTSTRRPLHHAILTQMPPPYPHCRGHEVLSSTYVIYTMNFFLDKWAIAPQATTVDGTPPNQSNRGTSPRTDRSALIKSVKRLFVIGAKGRLEGHNHVLRFTGKIHLSSASVCFMTHRFGQ